MKPGLDRLVAFVGLFFLTPFFLLMALLLVFATGLNPVFRQQRIGCQGNLFWLYKFRTMTNTRDTIENLLPDADRITPIGRWLRRLSLDELPQLVNVLLGDMSLVGPRPLLAEYAPELAIHKRHTIKPGLTGWAQIHGRNHLSWPEKFGLDCWYTAHCTFSVDSLILWRTLFVLVDTSPPAKPITPCYSTEPEAIPAS
ncbi:MAG: sugar transferase [Rudanella sp.]|nr:sugar transferase [Rudanella sp.]